jgi:hypothetical protein
VVSDYQLRLVVLLCRYDTAELRQKKLEKKQKKGTLAPEEEEELRGVVELIAEREMQLSLLRKKQRGVFSSMAEVLLDPSRLLIDQDIKTVDVASSCPL